jgi:nitrogen fixation protein FixH
VKEFKIRHPKFKINTMNWGNKLLLVFAIFGAGMSYLVYRCMHVPVSLVSKEYYQEEVAYQQVIDSRGKADALSGKVQLTQDNQAISLALPADMKHRVITGNVVLYCPSNVRYDRSFTLHTDTATTRLLSKKALVPGNYIVKVSWQASGVSYYNEQPLAIQ